MTHNNVDYSDHILIAKPGADIHHPQLGEKYIRRIHLTDGQKLPSGFEQVHVIQNDQTIDRDGKLKHRYWKYDLHDPKVDLP